MKKKEKTVLCLIFLAAILYSGITYLAVGYTVHPVYRHAWHNWYCQYHMYHKRGRYSDDCRHLVRNLLSFGNMLRPVLRAWGHCLIFGSAGAEQCKIYRPVSGGMYHIGPCLCK